MARRLWELTEAELRALARQRAGLEKPWDEFVDNDFQRLRDEEERLKAVVRRAWSTGREVPEYTARWASEEGRFDPLKSDLPSKPLYHATAARDAVRREGLRTAAEGRAPGLGGSGMHAVSLTESPAIARDVHRGLLELNRMAKGKMTASAMLESARQGHGAKRPYLNEIGAYFAGDPDWTPARGLPPNLDRVLRGVKRERDILGWRTKGSGWTPVPESYSWVGGDGQTRYAEWERPMTEKERRDARYDVWKVFVMARSQAGGPADPVAFGPDLEKHAAVDPSQIATMRFRAKPGARGIWVPGEEEWRVQHGKAVRLVDVPRYKVKNPLFNVWAMAVVGLVAWGLVDRYGGVREWPATTSS